MEQNNAPVRRVGTVTMGLLLIIAGGIMLGSLFFPQWDFTPLIKAGPLVLVSLGVETLLAARANCRVKYDWVSMLLSCLIVTTALGMTVVAWCLLHGAVHW